MKTAGTKALSVKSAVRRASEQKNIRMRALVAVAAGGMLVTGCSLIDRVRGEQEVPELSESSLNRLLLGAGEINSIVGGPGMEADTETSDDLGTGPDDISDEDCLGAAFPALRPVYSGSGWSAVQRESVIDSEGSHGVLQAVVLFRSADRAREFFDASRGTFETCASNEVQIARGTENEASIEIGRFADTEDAGEAVIAQQLEKFDGSLDCQHAMGVVSNLVAEVEVCFADDAVADEAEIIVTRILADAENVATDENAVDG